MDVVSFTVDHDRMKKGVYVSRVDKVNGLDNAIVTTFDIRMKTPNKEPVLDNASIHTLEHLMAVYLRGNKDIKDKVIYIGPMGCRTGMYLILSGEYKSIDIVPLLKDTFSYVVNFNEKIPATTSVECGNYLDHNLDFAKYEAQKFLDVLNNLTEENLNYPA